MSAHTEAKKTHGTPEQGNHVASIRQGTKRMLLYNANGLVTIHISWNALEAASKKFTKELSEENIMKMVGTDIYFASIELNMPKWYFS